MKLNPEERKLMIQSKKQEAKIIKFIMNVFRGLGLLGIILAIGSAITTPSELVGTIIISIIIGITFIYFPSKICKKNEYMRWLEVLQNNQEEIYPVKLIDVALLKRHGESERLHIVYEWDGQRRTTSNGSKLLLNVPLGEEVMMISTCKLPIEDNKVQILGVTQVDYIYIIPYNFVELVQQQQ